MEIKQSSKRSNTCRSKLKLMNFLNVVIGVHSSPSDNESSFTCPEEFGYYPHPDDCSKYFVCVFGGPLLERCTIGLMYR